MWTCGNGTPGFITRGVERVSVGGCTYRAPYLPSGTPIPPAGDTTIATARAPSDERRLKTESRLHGRGYEGRVTGAVLPGQAHGPSLSLLVGLGP